MQLYVIDCSNYLHGVLNTDIIWKQNFIKKKTDNNYTVRPTEQSKRTPQEDRE